EGQRGVRNGPAAAVPSPRDFPVRTAERNLMSYQPSLVLSFTVFAVLVPAPAAAHFSLEQGSTHLSRYGDSEIKSGPCGRSGGTRGENVYSYRPGETIRVEIVEFIGHPGYFRIAFDDDGDDAFVDP